jgi:hypothetical protein
MQTIPFNSNITTALIRTVEQDNSGNDSLAKLSQEALTVDMPFDIVNNFSSNYGKVVTAQDTVAILKGLPQRHFVDIGNRRFDNVDVINSFYFLYMLSSGYCSFGCSAVSPFSATAKSLYRFNSDVSLRLNKSTESPQDSPVEGYAMNLSSVTIEQTSVIEESVNLNFVPAQILPSTSSLPGPLVEFKIINDRYVVISRNGGTTLTASLFDFAGVLQEQVELPITFDINKSVWAEVHDCKLAVAHNDNVVLISDRGAILYNGVNVFNDITGLTWGSSYGRQGFFLTDRQAFATGRLVFVAPGFSATIHEESLGATCLTRTENEVIVGFCDGVLDARIVIVSTGQQTRIEDFVAPSGFGNLYLAGLAVINSELVAIISGLGGVVNYRFNSPNDIGFVTALSAFSVETSPKILRTGAGVICFFPNTTASAGSAINTVVPSYCDIDTGSTNLAATAYSLHRTIGVEFIDDTGVNISTPGMSLTGLAVVDGVFVGMDNTNLFTLHPKLRSQRAFPFTRTLRVNTRLPYPTRYVEGAAL